MRCLSGWSHVVYCRSVPPSADTVRSARDVYERRKTPKQIVSETTNMIINAFLLFITLAYILLAQKSMEIFDCTCVCVYVRDLCAASSVRCDRVVTRVHGGSWMPSPTLSASLNAGLL